ncbi:MAG: twin-arginine translocase TatA/TatE family subunit [Micrococcales bacterium]
MRAIFENPLFLIVIVLLILVWGGSKLPNASKNLAQSLKIFRKEMKSDDTKSTDKDSKKADDQSND